MLIKPAAIKLLSPLLANQIAAGEVIERPASVVKELLENSLDAGASDIEITIEQGGSKLIRIRDNGSGISQNDLPLAIKTHATSKIAVLEDLDAITSLGFRGEALASIASVSRMHIISKPNDQKIAYSLKVDGYQVSPTLSPIAHPLGTTIEVRDLFYNTPARKKFLRAEKTELNHIEQLVRRIALVAFDKKIVLMHNDKKVLQLPEANNTLDREKRVGKLFGSDFIRQASYFERQDQSMTLSGWIANNNFMRSSNDLQFFYLNGRLIRDKLIMHALRQAYAEQLYPGRQAAYCLYLTLNPSEVDVNVHPTKHEVRFRQSLMVHDFIVSAVKYIFDQSEKSQEIAKQLSLREPKAYYHSNVISSDSSSDGQAMIIHERFYLHYYNGQLMLGDIHHAAHALCYQQMQADLLSGPVQSRRILVPINLTIEKKWLDVLQYYENMLKQWGWVIQLSGESCVFIREIPKYLNDADIKRTVSSLLENLQAHYSSPLSSTMQEKQLHHIAQSNTPLQISLEQARQLFTQLRSYDDALHQYQGRAYLKAMEQQPLMRFFHD